MILCFTFINARILFNRVNKQKTPVLRIFEGWTSLPFSPEAFGEVGYSHLNCDLLDKSCDIIDIRSTQ